MKQISKQVAHEKYGVIISGVNSTYRYYLTEDGKVIDSDGDVRYIPRENGHEEQETDKKHKETNKRL